MAHAAFEVERLTQGGGSPVDTSTSTAGGGIAIAGSDKPPNVGEVLWEVGWEDRSWTVERIALPELSLVIANSGVRGRTDEQVAKVARAAQKDVIVRETLADIGHIARDAVPLLGRRVVRLSSLKHSLVGASMVGVIQHRVLCRVPPVI